METMTKIELIDSMTDAQFEQFLVQLFKNIGVKKVTLVRGLGASRSLVAVDDDIKTTLIKAKIAKGPVDAAFIHETLAEKTYREASKALVITNYRFSQAAKELGIRHGIELWERADLVDILSRSAEVDNDSGYWFMRLFRWFR